MVVKSIEESDRFKRIFNKLKGDFQERIEKLIQKLINNPKIGKPMMYERKGTREVYFKPFRLSYAYSPEENKITLLDLYHKKKQ